MKPPFPCRHAVALVLAELSTLFGAAVSGVPQQNLAFSKFVFTQRVSIPQTGANLAGWRFSLWQGRIQNEKSPALPAKLCAVQAESRSHAQEICYEGRAGNDIFPQQAEAKPFVIRGSPPECQAILFQAVSSWGGSGWGRLLALLVPDEPNRVLRNLLPDVVVSSQGESRFWDEPTFSPYRLLTVADVVGDGDEAHFTEHLYKIRTYAYREDRGSFLLIDEYKTSKKYASLDETDKIDVLGPEHAVIRRRILRLKPMVASEERQKWYPWDRNEDPKAYEYRGIPAPRRKLLTSLNWQPLRSQPTGRQRFERQSQERRAGLEGRN